MGLDECKLIDLPRINDPRGNLTFLETERHVPFEFKRVYYLYDVPGGESRGGHAHRVLQQLIVSVMGAFDVVLTDLKLPGLHGLDLCERIVVNRPDIPVVVITAFGSMETAMAAIRASAYDFVRTYAKTTMRVAGTWKRR